MVKNLRRTFIISSAVITGLIAAYSPAIAASINLTIEPNCVSVSSFLLAADSIALDEAVEYLDSAVDALNSADAATNKVKKDAFFQAALTAMDAAADAMDVAGISTVEQVDDFTNAVDLAKVAIAEQEQQKYIDAALSAIEDIKEAIDQANVNYEQNN